MVIDAGFEGSLTTLPQIAQHIENSAQFSGMWVNDTSNDPFLLSSLVALNTQELQFGTNIAVAFARSPFCVAQTAYNLAQLSQGRFLLGLGTQVKAHVQRRFGQTWPEKPVKALIEYVALLRHLFECFKEKQRPDFKGDFFSCTLTSPVFSPDIHQFDAPRVGFSAVGPIATRAAGRFADAVFLHPFTHLTYLDSITLPALKEGEKKRSDKLAKLEKIGSAFCLASDSPQLPKQKAQVLSRLAFYASTPNYNPVLASLGLEELQTELHQLSRQSEWEKMARILPDELIEACVIIAPRDKLISSLHKRFQGIYDRVIVDPRLFS